MILEFSGALEAEESKVMRAQVEVSQIRSEIEKRIQEKEEDFENTRRNHQRALESMHASLEAESKSKNELLRVKKKLEADINELEIALDHANKANADAQKNLKRCNEQIRETQLQVRFFLDRHWVWNPRCYQNTVKSPTQLIQAFHLISSQQSN